MTSARPESDDDDGLEAAVDQAISACGGDMRSTIRALIVANEFLENEVGELMKAVSRAHSRGRFQPVIVIRFGPCRRHGGIRDRLRPYVPLLFSSSQSDLWPVRLLRRLFSSASLLAPACEASRGPDVSNEFDDDTDGPPAMRASFNCNASHARPANRPWFDRASLC